MEKYGFVYIWYDRKHKRYYIGCHWGTEDDGYICSSNWMNTSYNRRTADFKRKIIVKTYIREELFELESQYLNMIKPGEFGKKYYNFQTTWKHWSEKEHSRLTTRERISIKTKEAMQRPEVRENYLAALKNRDNRSSELEVRAKRSKSMIGKNVGKDNSKAIEAARLVNTGRNISDDHRSKIAAAGVFKAMNSKKIKCKYCGTEGNPGNIGRYHNDKCKLINSLSITG